MKLKFENMAHHWSQQFENQMSKEDAENLFKKKSPDEPGATCRFPDGKMDPLDEGEIQMRVGTIDGRVIVEFGKPITSIGFTKDEVLAFGQALIEKGLSL